jgi:predicted RNase H-like nuclease (RuvC/YqgF family)
MTSSETGEKMASVDVSEKLQEMEGQLRRHENLHQDNSETLREVKNVLVGQAKLTERILHLDRRLETTEERHEKTIDKVEQAIDKMDERIDVNQKVIWRWSGGMTALLAFMGLLSAVSKFLPPVTL